MSYLRISKLNSLAVFLASLALLSACGGGNSVAIKSVDLTTKLVNTDTYVGMDAKITMGNLKFPNIEIPILNPSNLSVLGQLDLLANADGTNDMIVSVDFTTATKLSPGLGTNLPNTRELPLSLNLGTTQLIGIPILQNSRIYVGGQLDGTAVVGAAISISAFDGIFGNVATPLNVFVSYPFSAQVLGVGGFFTSPSAGQNGVAVFVEKIKPTPVPVTSSKFAVHANLQATQVQTGPASDPTELDQVDDGTLSDFGWLLNRHRTLRIK